MVSLKTTVKMTLSIVILSYNTKNLTLSCLSTLQELYKGELENETLEVLVVDNASTDGSYEALVKFAQAKKGISIIKSTKNLGFGGGNNIGAKKAKGRYILFLNSDTEVLDKGFLKMVEFFEANPKVGILGPKLVNFDGSPQPSVANFYGLLNLFIMLLGLEKRKSPEKIERVDWITGAATMIQKRVFEEIGSFDENIFMYMDDHELCFRAQKKGFATYFFPEAMVKHKSVGSSNKSFAVVNIYRNILYFYKKHKSRIEYLVARILLFSKAIAVYTLGKFLRNRYYVDTYSKALRETI